MDDLLSRRLRPSPQAIETALGAETLILHLGNDTYYGLDPVGTRIWVGLKEGAGLPAIRDRLAREFAVDPTRVEVDMRRFLGDLLAHDLVLDG